MFLSYLWISFEMCVWYKLCTISGPDVTIFKRFRQYWGNTNTEKFELGTINVFKQKNESDVHFDVINVIVNYLQIKKP